MKSRAHIRYKNAEGKLVPGTTTVTGLLAKPQLIVWANRLGLNGIDSTRFVDDKADIGTLAHQLITDRLLGSKTDTDDYSKKQIDAAENAVISYYEWEKNHEIEPIIIEQPLVSEKYQYGGTPDIYAVVDKEFELLDLKTGGGIYEEMVIQLAAYKHLHEEQGHTIKRTRIIRIGRDEDEGFEIRTYTDLEKYWQIFEHLLAVYYLRKKK